MKPPAASREADDRGSHLRDARLRARRIGEPPPRLEDRIKGTGKRKSSQAAKGPRKGSAPNPPSKWLARGPKRKESVKAPPRRIGTKAVRPTPATRVVGVSQRAPRVPVPPQSAAPQGL